MKAWLGVVAGILLYQNIEGGFSFAETVSAVYFSGLTIMVDRINEWWKP